MKKMIVMIAAVVGLSVSVLLIFHRDSVPVQSKKTDEGKILYYTCPMHSQIRRDGPGNCPICGMTLIAVHDHSASEVGSAKSGAVGVTISPDDQRLSGIQTAAVARKEVFRDIRTTGRVAFDPELAVALREYQEVLKTFPQMKESSILRLKHLGLSEEEIADIRSETDLSTHYHLVSKEGPLWIYATVFEDESRLIKGGEAAAIELSESKTHIKGIVRSLAPMVDPATRSIRARIEVLERDEAHVLRPDTFVTVTIKVPLGNQLTVPTSALIRTGERQVVFVKGADNRFEERVVQAGSEAGSEVVIENGVSEGDEVVTSASFFIDSETRLKGTSL